MATAAEGLPRKSIEVARSLIDAAYLARALETIVMISPRGRMSLDD
jgi:hypothetical protein